jgi:ABC-type glycerol-3-phosphate transport system substrate-binding protein
MMRKLIKKGGKELDIFPIPVPGEEKKFVYRPVSTIGICNSCKNKKAAFEFITFLISDKMMANPGDNHLNDMPVNKAAANKLMAHFQKEPIGGLALPDRIMNKIFYTLDNLQKLALGDGQVALIVHKYYQQYLNDEITVEEAVKKMKMSADLYLGE